MTDQLQILWQPLLPIWVLVIVSCVAAMLAGFALFRKARGIWLRLCFFSIFIIALFNPSLVAEQYAQEKDTALIVVDQTSSMQLGSRTQQSDRAVKSLTEKLAKLGDIEPVILPVTGANSSNLITAIQQKLAEMPANRLAGVIMVTDGQVHDAPPELPMLKSPLHVLITGSKQEIDRRIKIVSAPAYGMAGQTVPVTVNVTDYPKPQSEKAELTLLHEDGTTQSYVVPVGRDVTLDLPVARPGHNLFVLSVPTLANELTERNNSASLTINGIRDRLRVLLISGEPHSGERVWRNFLKADPAVDLVHFTILRSPDKFNGVPNHELALIPFPVNELFEDKLKTFDLVIFDRFHRTELVPPEYMSNIADYVLQGGALLVSESTANDVEDRLVYSPLATILPAKVTARTLAGKVLTGAYRPTLSELGLRHPVTNSFSKEVTENWGHWLRQIEATPASDSTVLMNGLQDKPLLVVGRAGEGRVAQFLSDQFWLWARNYDGGGPQAELLRRLAHWLMQEPELDETAFTAESSQLEQGWQIAIKLRSLKSRTEQVTLTAPDQQIQSVTLQQGEQAGLLTAQVTVGSTGLYRLRHNDREIVVMVGISDAAEFMGMEATEEKMRPLVQQTGGGIAWLEDQPEAPELRRTDRGADQTGWGNWFGLQRSNEQRITGSTAYPLWPAWLLLIVLLGFALGSWRREGSS